MNELCILNNTFIYGKIYSGVLLEHIRLGVILASDKYLHFGIKIYGMVMILRLCVIPVVIDLIVSHR